MAAVVGKIKSAREIVEGMVQEAVDVMRKGMMFVGGERGSKL